VLVGRLPSGSPVDEEALHRIAQLYAIEQQASDCTATDRRALREQNALPALENMHSWLLASQRAVAVGRRAATAIDHELKRWSVLQRYASSGACPSITTRSRT
jgi:transposase